MCLAAWRPKQRCPCFQTIMHFRLNVHVCMVITVVHLPALASIAYVPGRIFYRIQIICHSYIAQMEWPRIVPNEIGIYLLYVCYNS